MNLEGQRGKLIVEIEQAITGFNKGIPGIQKEIYRQILLALKDLEVTGGVVRNNRENIKLLSKLMMQVENAILKNDSYIGEVKDFLKYFGAVTNIQNDYFKMLEKGYKPFDALNEVRKLSVSKTIADLTEVGMKANVVDKVRDILFQNITSGVKYEDLVSQVRSYIVGSGGQEGAMVRYAKQITTDSLNQYSATYNKLVSDDLGLKWRIYSGTLIATSRCFCRACVKKKYIHISELDAVVKGNFDEFKSMECTIYDKTGLPQGMWKGTNAANFEVRRGGPNCGHQLFAVSAAIVPADLRARFK